MGAAYLLVHLKFTIPTALVLAFVHAPLRTRVDVYKLAFITMIALAASIPWDAYLIRNGIWTYPAGGVLGPTIHGIPVEEVFFFIVQTWCTAVLYLLLRKQVLFEGYLKMAAARRTGGVLGALALAGMVGAGAAAWSRGGEGTYMGWIAMWGGLVLLGLWLLAGKMILSLPAKVTTFPVVVPTLCLWALDTAELRRGTWVIEDGTKLGIQLWDGLEIEEAVFFIVTNCLIVSGLIAFDYGMALAAAFPSRFPDRVGIAGVLEGVKAMRLVWEDLPVDDEYAGIMEAQNILKLKSRSFYLASGVFQGRLRLDLISLYSFCRAADDLIDESPSPAAASAACDSLRKFLEIAYTHPDTHPGQNLALKAYVEKVFPTSSHAALLSLPTHRLPRKPLDGLLSGFRTDLTFPSIAAAASQFPIQTPVDLLLYSKRVAGTVGEMFTILVLARNPITGDHREILRQAEIMGTALQYVNIARDVEKDAAIGRVYIPASWIDPSVVLADPTAAAEAARERLLAAAEERYVDARGAVEELPMEARAGARVAVEAYMDIGRRLTEDGYAHNGDGLRGKAVRAWRAWKLMRK